MFGHWPQKDWIGVFLENIFFSNRNVKGKHIEGENSTVKY